MITGLLLVEFDVPSVVQADTAAGSGSTAADLLDPVRVGTILHAYAKGVAEYAPLGEDGMRVLV